ncbi:tyrosine-type recombinase/integrase [Flavobacteriaceae bacterium KMM 6897]|nr:tyrosine-type recombinase/integrase [Flavobacteriaceae bacterium KMM 6897]
MKSFRKKFSIEYVNEYVYNSKKHFVMLYSTPKLYIPKIIVNGKKKATIKKGKRWYVYFYYRDPDTGKMGNSPFKIYREINSFKSIKERRIVGNWYKNVVHGWLKDGFDPFDEASKEKILNKTRVFSVQDMMTVRVAFEHGLEHKKNSLKKESFNMYRNYMRLFLAWCEEKKLDTLDITNLREKDVIDYLNYLRKEPPLGRGLKPTSVANTKRHLGAIMAKLYEDKIVSVNIFSNIKTKKGKPEKNQPFTEEEVRSIKEYCIENEPVLYDFLRFIFYSFMRNQEIVRIQLHHINMDKKLIAIPTKSEKLSYILMIEPMFQFLESLELEKYPKDSFLFTPSGTPGPWDTSEKGRVAYFSKRFLTIKDHFGFDANKTTYSFRHNAAVDLFQSFIKSGLSEREAIGKLMAITRHKSENALRNYLRDIGAVVPKDWSDSYNMDF